MKNFAYAKRQTRDLTAHLYEDDSIPIDTSVISALMMCRLDFDIKIIEVPQVSEEEIISLLGYRLRSIYPGDPGDTVFDHKIVTSQKKYYAILFITSKQNLEQYKEIASRKPLFLPYTIVEDHLKKQQGDDFIYLYWNYDWVDILIFKNRILHSATAVKREKEVTLDILKIRNILPSDYAAFSCFFLGLQAEHSELVEKSGQLFTGAEAVVYEDVEKILLGFSKKKESLFRKKRQLGNITKKLKLEVLLLPVILLLCLLFNKHVNTREEYKQLLEKTQSNKIEQSRVLQEYRKMVNDFGKLRTRRPMDTYVLLSEISKIMAGDAILYGFKMRSRDFSFNLEGEAFNPQQKYIDKLSSNPAFKTFNFDEILRDTQIKKDRFKISGVFNANE